MKSLVYSNVYELDLTGSLTKNYCKKNEICCLKSKNLYICSKINQLLYLYYHFVLESWLVGYICDIHVDVCHITMHDDVKMKNFLWKTSIFYLLIIWMDIKTVRLEKLDSIE